LKEFAMHRTVLAMPALLLSLAAGAAERPAQLLKTGCELPVHVEGRMFDAGDSVAVKLAYLVDESGKVVASKVLESSGSSRIDRASLYAAGRCRFKPGERDGQATISWARVQYEWNLK
jgi:TonB family protein